MVLESLPNLLLPLLSTLFRSALFATTVTVCSIVGSIWWLRRNRGGLARRFGHRRISKSAGSPPILIINVDFLVIL